ncbi:MAG: hypothetical protein IT310_15180 [Anaerolineales bacterium]|nr:hypothetical protein [Anaerolineales bacterium]
MKKYKLYKVLVASLLLLTTACAGNRNINRGGTNAFSEKQNSENRVATPAKFQVILSGGYETDPRDRGRPVVLIASMLGVTPEVFREAFSAVHPAGAGSSPTEAQAQANKAALLSALAPYGVTNDWLDEVSNYYRYNRKAGETWPQVPAEVEALVENGVVTGFKIIHPGSGYTSAPTITVAGTDVSATATVAFTTDFATNGSIREVRLNP